MTDFETHPVKDGWVEVVSGTKFYFGTPTDDMIRVEDVAYSLSRLCRYNGHTKRHYSVAEHCVLLADYAEGTGRTARECLTVLHHDDAEYIIGDLSRPIKVKMPQFKELETILDRALALKFHTIWPSPPWLKELDARIVRDERAAVLNRSDNNWGTDGLEPLGVRFWGLLGRFPFIMQEIFLERHERWSDAMMEQEGYQLVEFGP